MKGIKTFGCFGLVFPRRFGLSDSPAMKGIKTLASESRGGRVHGLSDSPAMKGIKTRGVLRFARARAAVFQTAPR